MSKEATKLVVIGFEADEVWDCLVVLFCAGFGGIVGGLTASGMGCFRRGRCLVEGGHEVGGTRIGAFDLFGVVVAPGAGGARRRGDGGLLYVADGALVLEGRQDRGPGIRETGGKGGDVLEAAGIRHFVLDWFFFCLRLCEKNDGCSSRTEVNVTMPTQPLAVFRFVVISRISASMHLTKGRTASAAKPPSWDASLPLTQT